MTNWDERQAGTQLVSCLRTFLQPGRSNRTLQQPCELFLSRARCGLFLSRERCGLFLSRARCGLFLSRARCGLFLSHARTAHSYGRSLLSQHWAPPAADLRQGVFLWV